MYSDKQRRGITQTCGAFEDFSARKQLSVARSVALWLLVFVVVIRRFETLRLCQYATDSLHIDICDHIIPVDVPSRTFAPGNGSPTEA